MKHIRRLRVYVADRHNHRIQVFDLSQSCPIEGTQTNEKPEPQQGAKSVQDRINATEPGIRTSELTRC